MLSPSLSRITKRMRSSITELSFHGIPLPPPSRGKSVTHVSGTFRYLCVERQIDNGRPVSLLLFDLILGQWRRRSVELDGRVGAEFLIEAEFDVILRKIFVGARSQHYFQWYQELAVADLLEIVIEYFLRGVHWKRFGNVIRFLRNVHDHVRVDVNVDQAAVSRNDPIGFFPDDTVLGV